MWLESDLSLTQEWHRHYPAGCCRETAANPPLQE